MQQQNARDVMSIRFENLTIYFHIHVTGARVIRCNTMGSLRRLGRVFLSSKSQQSAAVVKVGGDRGRALQGINLELTNLSLLFLVYMRGAWH